MSQRQSQDPKKGQQVAEPREERFGMADAGFSRAERRRREKARAKRKAGRTPSGVGWLAGIGVAGVAGVVVLVVALVSSSAGGSKPSAGPAPSGTSTFTETGRSHVQGKVVYDRIPPAGGNHSGVWLNCGVYDQAVPNENAVHSLEHGAVWITYQLSLAAADLQALQLLAISKYSGAGRYVIVSPYPDLPAPIVATAWGNQLKLPSVSDPRLAQFIDHFREGPQDLEPGAACTGGVGTPIG
jgi:hypothetical protein